MKPSTVIAFVIAIGLLQPALAQQQLSVKPVVEKKLAALPAGPLYWRIENFPTLAAAQGAVGPTSLAAEISGKVWLFTLGATGGTTPGGSKVAEIGPVPAISAPRCARPCRTAPTSWSTRSAGHSRNHPSARCAGGAGS